jgi:hypothetical protein
MQAEVSESGPGRGVYSDLFQPCGGFPDGVQVENGHIVLPELPGIGFASRVELNSEMQGLSRFQLACAGKGRSLAGLL